MLEAPPPFLLLPLGFLFGIFAVLFGGSMFFSVPIFQWFFPGASMGAIVGNIKVGSAVRGVFSTLATWRDIDVTALPRYAPLLIGATVGPMIITNLSQDWILPVVIVGIVVTIFGERIGGVIARYAAASPANRAAMLLFSAIVGFYGGFFGAGIALLLAAVLRVVEPVRYGDDSKIGLLKIQARFLEFVLGLAAIGGHVLAGSISLAGADMWLWWALGGAAGGFTGGVLLTYVKDLGVWPQRAMLWASFTVALVMATLVWLGVIDISPSASAA